jgi:hypothetical protein
VAAVIPAERFQVDGFHFQVYENRVTEGFTALGKAVPFVHFAQPIFEPSGDKVWFEFGVSAEEAYTRLRLSMGLEVG